MLEHWVDLIKLHFFEERGVHVSFILVILRYGLLRRGLTLAGTQLLGAFGVPLASLQIALALFDLVI